MYERLKLLILNKNNERHFMYNISINICCGNKYIYIKICQRKGISRFSLK